MHATWIDQNSQQDKKWFELKETLPLAKAIEEFVIDKYSQVPDFYQAVRYLRATVHGISRSLTRFKRKYPLCEGAQPVSLMKADIPKLYYRDIKYLISPKSNGTRYQCLFLTVGEERILAFRQPQTKRKYLVAASGVPETLFLGTLWDGELVHTPTGWTYHVFGNICTSNTFVALKPFTERMEGIQSLFQQWQPNASSIQLDGCPIGFHVKRFFLMKEAAAYLDYCKTCGYDVDGIIFQPSEFTEVVGTHFKLYKMKEATDNTADLLATRETGKANQTFKYMTAQEIHPGEVYYVLSTDKGPFSYMKVKQKNVLFSLEQDLDGKIIEVRWNKQGHWELEKIRFNKRKPNREETVYATLKNIQEGLVLEDVFPFLASH